MTDSSSDAGSSTDPARRQRRVVEVAAGLVFRDGKLLITQRHADAHLGGLWEFPGGKREGNETFEQCLERELREELGIEVVIGPVIETLTHAYPEKTVYLQFIQCRWKEREPQPLGCPAFQWISPAQLSDFDFPAADAHLIKTLRRRTELWS